MEEHQSAQLKKDDDEEVYEKIEAPKYVDFTVPDLPVPDDRSWFCLRVGCDQKHEEDMDPDALYRSFVLRVMAARSPNLKFQKALSRQAPRGNIKCPQSAPAKSSKNRISRLTAITLASQQMANKRLKAHPISRLNSASQDKDKQSSVAAKALTTPRHKKHIPGPDPLSSARNPKTTVSLTKSRVVSKALIFHTPKKNERLKTSVQSHYRVTELCSQVKKLEITSQQKQGSSRVVSSRYNTCNASNKVPTSNISKAHLRARKLKSHAEVSFISQGSKSSQVAESSQCVKRKTKASLPRCNQSMPHEQVDDDSSDMEIDGKSRDGSLKACSVSGSSGNNEKPGHDKPLIVVKASENLCATSTQDERIPNEEYPLASSSNVTALLSNLGDVGSYSEERKDIEGGVPKIQSAKVRRVENYAKGTDKENAFVSYDNREININNSQSETKILSKQEPHEKTQKVIREFDKRDCSASAATGAQKYKKAKPTNPKPFRLRTDERGILKEAGLNKRLHLLAPSKENATVQRLSTGTLQRRHLKESQKTKKSHDCSQTKSGKRVQKQQLKNACPKTSKCAKETKVVSTIQQRQKSEDSKESSVQKAASSSKKGRSPFMRQQSPFMRQQLVKPQRMVSVGKATAPLASTSQMSTIKEPTSVITRPKKVVEPTDNGTTDNIIKATAIRSCSRGKRPATIPKKPNFQSVHVPKSSTKKLSQEIPS